MSSVDDDTIPVGSIILGMIGVVILVIALYIAGAYTNWFGLAVTAPARVQSENLQTENIIQKQNYFFATHQDYQRSLVQIALYKARAKADEHSDAPIRQADSDGVIANQQSCLATAADYNGQAANFNSGQFRSINLPVSLDLGACSQ